MVRANDFARSGIDFHKRILPSKIYYYEKHIIITFVKVVLLLKYLYLTTFNYLCVLTVEVSRVFLYIQARLFSFFFRQKVGTLSVQCGDNEIIMIRCLRFSLRRLKLPVQNLHCPYKVTLLFIIISYNKYGASYDAPRSLLGLGLRKKYSEK